VATMRSRRYRCRRAGLGCGLALLALAFAAGCEVPGPDVGPQLRDDIVAIQQYPPTDPWLRDDEGRITGLRTRIYLLPAAREEEVPKGVFVPGLIQASLYALTPRADGSYERQLVHEWSFDEREAAGYRISHPSVMGQSYGLLLRWPSNLDLAGREIQIMLSYQRKDGETIARRGTRFRVPLPLGVRSPHPTTTTPAPLHSDNERSAPGSRPAVKPGSE
jgi:hypothetical protein